MNVKVFSSQEIFETKNGLYWTKDDQLFENMTKYPMALEVQQAIKTALQNIKDNDYDIIEHTIWPADCQDSISFMREVLGNGELIPYIFPLKKYNTGYNTNVFNNIGKYNRTTSSRTGYYKESGGSTSDQDLYIYSCITKGSAAGGDYRGYLNKSDKYVSQFLYNDENSDIVVKPFTVSIEESLNIKSNSRFVKYEKESDMYDIQIFDLFKSVSQFKEENNGKIWIPSLYGLSNDEDGNISESNPRKNFTVAGGASVNGCVLVFLVKTTLPFINDDLTIDNTKEHVQYWAFNIASLFSGAPNGIQGDGLFDYNEYSRGSSKLSAPALISFSEDIIQQFNIPFPYYISKTSYFDKSKTSVVGNAYVGQSWYTNGTYSSILGQNLLSDKDSFERFLTQGLGLKATFNDNEFKYMNTSDWQLPPPEVQPEPGTGGQIGGQTGGGSGIGGTTEGDTSDTLPSGIINTGGARISNAYTLTQTNIENLQKNLVDDSIWTAISSMFKSDPMQGVINVINFPFDFEKIMTINDGDITILGQNASTQSHSVIGSPLPRSIRTRINMGTFSFPERFGSFLDYDPYTKITIYIPFVGFKQISANAVMRRQIKLEYDIDYGDGSCIAILRVSDQKGNGTDFSNISSYSTLYTFDGQIGQSIPLTSSDARNKTQNQIKGALGAITAASLAIATGGISAGAGVAAGSTTAAGTSGAGLIAAGAASTVAMNGANILMQKPTVSAGGVVSSQHSFALGLVPYVIIEYAETNVPERQGEFVGFQTNLYMNLNDVKGFTVCDDVKLKLSCTHEEANIIKGLLSKGVVLR